MYWACARLDAAGYLAIPRRCCRYANDIQNPEVVGTYSEAGGTKELAYSFLFLLPFTLHTRTRQYMWILQLLRRVLLYSLLALNVYDATPMFKPNQNKGISLDDSEEEEDSEDGEDGADDAEAAAEAAGTAAVRAHRFSVTLRETTSIEDYAAFLLHVLLTCLIFKAIHPQKKPTKTIQTLFFLTYKYKCVCVYSLQRTAALPLSMQQNSFLFTSTVACR